MKNVINLSTGIGTLKVATVCVSLKVTFSSKAPEKSSSVHTKIGGFSKQVTVNDTKKMAMLVLNGPIPTFFRTSKQIKRHGLAESHGQKKRVSIEGRQVVVCQGRSIDDVEIDTFIGKQHGTALDTPVDRKFR